MEIAFYFTSFHSSQSGIMRDVTVMWHFSTEVWNRQNIALKPDGISIEYNQNERLIQCASVATEQF
jgi:hypothetical protein